MGTSSDLQKPALGKSLHISNEIWVCWPVNLCETKGYMGIFPVSCTHGGATLSYFFSGQVFLKLNSFL